ncbi:DUF1488 family protein [Microvirga brassicacearum]|nr:DUF1488 family protein [Microvirga brassicacearum]
MSDEGMWREDIDSLAFRPDGHNGLCVVHRLAFRALVGARLSPEICLAYFREHRARFNDAARAKAGRKGLPAHSNFHLTSRDLRRAPTESA